MRARGGFTLVELLVTVGVIALLLSITIPALRGVRWRAQETAELSHQRQSGLALFAYADDHAGAFPYFGIPGTDFAPLKYHDGPFKGQWEGSPWFPTEYGHHWEQVWAWAYWIKGLGYTEADTAITYSTGERHVVAPLSGYGRALDVMTGAAIVRPSFLALNGPRRIEDHQGQRMQHVAYPSKKGVLRRENYLRYRATGWETLGPQIGRIPVYVWFADGHSGMHAPDTMLPGITDGISETWPPPTGSVFTTIDGIHGRDL